MKLVLKRILDESGGCLVGAEATERHSFLGVKDMDETGEIGCGEKSAVGTETDGGDDIWARETAGGGKRLGGKEGDGGGVSDGEGMRMDRRESEGGDGGGEVRYGVRFEGGPVSGVRGLRFRKGFRS